MYTTPRQHSRPRATLLARRGDAAGPSVDIDRYLHRVDGSVRESIPYVPRLSVLVEGLQHPSRPGSRPRAPAHLDAAVRDGVRGRRWEAELERRSARQRSSDLYEESPKDRRHIHYGPDYEYDYDFAGPYRYDYEDEEPLREMNPRCRGGGRDDEFRRSPKGRPHPGRSPAHRSPPPPSRGRRSRSPEEPEEAAMTIGASERVRYRNEVTSKVLQFVREISDIFDCRLTMEKEILNAMCVDPRYAKERQGVVKVAPRPTKEQRVALNGALASLEILQSACVELVATYLTPEEKRYLGLNTHFFQSRKERDTTYQYDGKKLRTSSRNAAVSASTPKPKAASTVRASHRTTKPSPKPTQRQTSASKGGAADDSFSDIPLASATLPTKKMPVGGPTTPASSLPASAGEREPSEGGSSRSSARPDAPPVRPTSATPPPTSSVPLSGCSAPARQSPETPEKRVPGSAGVSPDDTPADATTAPPPALHHSTSSPPLRPVPSPNAQGSSRTPSSPLHSSSAAGGRRTPLSRPPQGMVRVAAPPLPLSASRLNSTPASSFSAAPPVTAPPAKPSGLNFDKFKEFAIDSDSDSDD